jgi:hypothetical protein
MGLSGHSTGRIDSAVCRLYFEGIKVLTKPMSVWKEEKYPEAYKILYDWIKSKREPVDTDDICWICMGGGNRPHESDCIYVRARNLIGFDVHNDG